MIRVGSEYICKVHPIKSASNILYEFSFEYWQNSEESTPFFEGLNLI
jgi:hypothetical protein